MASLLGRRARQFLVGSARLGGDRLRLNRAIALFRVLSFLGRLVEVAAFERGSRSHQRFLGTLPIARDVLRGFGLISSRARRQYLREGRLRELRGVDGTLEGALR